MNILIDKVRIKNFRSLHDVTVELAPLIILVGTNNSGKTTFLRALNAVLGFSKNQLTRDDLFIGQSANSPSDEITIDIRIVPFDHKEGMKAKEFENNWVQVFGDGIMMDNEDEGQQTFGLRTKFTFGSGDSYETARNLLIDWEKELEGKEFGALRPILLYFLDAQRDLSEDARLRTSFFGRLAAQLHKEYNESALNELNEAIGALNEKAVQNSEVLTHLKGKLDALNTTTQGNGVGISPFPTKVRDLHKGMKVDFQDGGSDTFSLEYHGMGTRSWASILSFGAFISWEQKQAKGDAYFPVLALEEPEAHLHPNAQRTLYKQIKAFSGQKIVSTHSPYVVGQAELGELRFFNKEMDYTTVSMVPDLEGLREWEKNTLARFGLREKGHLLFSRFVVLAEGETEEVLLNLLAEKKFGVSPPHLGIDIVGCGGSNFRHYMSILKAAKIPFLVFSDYDNSETKTNVDKAIESVGLESQKSDYLIALGQNIEEFLCDNGHEAPMRKGCEAFIDDWFTNKVSKRIEEKGKIATKAGMTVWLEKFKAKAVHYYAPHIVQGGSLPPQIADLFQKIAIKLALPAPNNNQPTP